MPVFEYKAQSIPTVLRQSEGRDIPDWKGWLGGQAQAALNQLGAEGWELVAAVPVTRDSAEGKLDTIAIVWYLKRQLG